MYISLHANKYQCVCSVSTCCMGGIRLGVYLCDFHFIFSYDLGRGKSCGPEVSRLPGVTEQTGIGTGVCWLQSLCPWGRPPTLRCWGGGCLWVPQQTPRGAGQAYLHGGTGAGAAMFILVTSGHRSVLPPVPPRSHQCVRDGWALP